MTPEEESLLRQMLITATTALENVERRLSASRARERDLRARLKAARDWMLSVESETEWSREAKRATDLRRKNWRKP